MDFVCTVDDGTEVVDCLYQKPTIKPPPKPKEKGKAREVESKVEYLPLPGLDVGSTATVIGKVTSWRDGKQVVAESVGAPLHPCQVGEVILSWMSRSAMPIH